MPEHAKTDGPRQPASDDGSSEREERRSLPEKVTLAVSLTVVLVLIGYIAWHGLFVERGTAMAAARVRREEAKQTATGQWVTPVEVRNLSDLPLEDVQVKVEVTTPEGKTADIGLSFPYLAERAAETAFIVTQSEPKKAAPQAAVESFKQQADSQGY